MSNKKDLTDALQDLREEIISLENSDGDAQDNLMQLVSLMQHQIDGTQAKVTELHIDDEANQSIADIIASYEANHPRLTAMANDLMTKLAAMGI